MKAAGLAAARSLQRSCSRPAAALFPSNQREPRRFALAQKKLRWFNIRRARSWSDCLTSS